MDYASQQPRKQALKSFVAIPREHIQQLRNDPDLLALYTILVAMARFQHSSQKTPKGQELLPGQAVTSKRRIASEFGWTESKSYRALKRLQDRNMIELSANRDGCIVTLIGWPFCARLKIGQRNASEPKSNQDRNGSETPANRERTHTKNKKEHKEESPPTPSLSATSVSENATWREGVEEIRKMLKERGVSAVEKAIERAQETGKTPEDVRALIAEFDSKPGAWSGGALFDCVVGILAQWPPVADSYRRQQERSAVQAQGDDQRREHERRLSEIADEKRERDRLETEYGAKLDAMDGRQIRAFTINVCGDDAQGYLWQWRGTGPLRGEHRVALLQALELEEHGQLNGRAH